VDVSFLTSDENRKLVLDANIPLRISNLIDSVTSLPTSDSNDRRKLLGVGELKMLRASAGALLNSSLKFGELSPFLPTLGVKPVQRLGTSKLKYIIVYADPIRRELARSEILCSLLSLIDNRPSSTSAKPVYFVGAHLQGTNKGTEESSDEEWEERLELGETIAGWTMNILEDVLSEGKSRRLTL
jgi:hypothetical protein